jgi:hypothetical protein
VAVARTKDALVLSAVLFKSESSWAYKLRFSVIKTPTLKAISTSASTPMYHTVNRVRTELNI